jgi:hypothetical protein
MDGCEFTYRLSRRPRMNRGGATLLGYSAFALGMALSALQPSFAPLVRNVGKVRFRRKWDQQFESAFLQAGHRGS